MGPARIEDAVWAYEDPLPECGAVAGLLGFDDTKLEVSAELPVPATLPSPATPGGSG